MSKSKSFLFFIFFLYLFLPDVSRLHQECLVSLFRCVYHGCPVCYRDKSVRLPTSGKTVGQVYEATKKREKLIKEAGYELFTKWQCQWVAECRSNPKKKEFVETLDIMPRLDPREAFYGGLVKTLILLIFF